MEPAESVKTLVPSWMLKVQCKDMWLIYVACISYYHPWELRRVCRYLNHETAVKVANTFVNSRLDYCNSLLYNTKRHILADYREFKMPCHTLCKLNKFSHVTPFLHKLHWLPIHYHIMFKYNLLTYKAIHFSQPLYLFSD